MGLLDWLTEGAGSSMGGSSMSMPPSMLTGMPPVQQTGADAYPRGGDPVADQPPMPRGGDPMTAGGAPPNGPGLPYPPGLDPMAAGGDVPNGPGLPPAPPMAMNSSPLTKSYNTDGSPALPPAGPTSGAEMPPGPPTSLLPPNLAPPMAPSGVGPQGFIGRALGLDRNSAKQISGSLASGLKSVGDNANKPGLAAFSGSAGSALEGGNAAEDKTEDKQLKYLQQAIAEAQAGNTAKLNIARTQLALAQAKAAREGDPEKSALTVARTRESTARARKLEADGGGSKASVVNSPEQLYLRAIGATNSDGKLSLLKNAYIQASKDGQQDTPAAKAAKTAYETAYDETRDSHLKTLGVDPKIASKIGKQPGFSADNPIPSAGLTKEKFDALPPGAYFVNPKDGRLLIKQPPAGANPTPAASSPTPTAPPPVPVTAPAGSAADRDDED